MSSLNKELESLDKRLDILNTEFDNNEQRTISVQNILSHKE